MNFKLIFSVMSLLAVFLWVSCSTTVNNNGGSTSGGSIVITSITNIATIVTGDAAIVACRDNYAFLYGWNAIAYSNFLIYDMSNPASPVKKGWLTNGGSGYGLVLNGNYAYLQTDGSGANLFVSGGNVIVDISDLNNPKEVMRTSDGYYSDYQNYLHNGYLYTFSYHLIGVFNMSSPASFNWVTNITNSAPDFKWGAFSGNYLYLANNNTFQIYNIADPAAYTLVGTNYVGVTLSSGGCAVKGDYAYLGGIQTNIVIMNVANPANPVMVTNYYFNTNAVTSGEFYEMKILGNYLLLSGERDFVVMNIEDPTNISYIDSVRMTNNNGWGFDILNNRYAVVADNICYYVIKLY